MGALCTNIRDVITEVEAALRNVKKRAAVILASFDKNLKALRKMIQTESSSRGGKKRKAPTGTPSKDTGVAVDLGSDMVASLAAIGFACARISREAMSMCIVTLKRSMIMPGRVCSDLNLCPKRSSHSQSSQRRLSSSDRRVRLAR